MGIFRKRSRNSDLVTLHYGTSRELDGFIVQKVFDGALAFVEFRTKSGNFRFTVDIGCPTCRVAMDYIDGDDSVMEYLASYAMVLYVNGTRFITPAYIRDETELIKKDVGRIAEYIDRAPHTEEADKEAIESMRGMYDDERSRK